METEAKLLIQSMMRTGVVEYAWSFMLRMESSRNPDLQRKHAVTAWINGAVVDVAPTDEISARAHAFEALGVKPSDAIHLACAEFASCDWFFTVDRGILRKIRNVGSMRVANPVEFVLEGST
ncbi:MAG: PIN domain protein [Kiritimatiellae bacterium]|nr:PIN domain protein [Kiritimatiellia bacterium]